MSVFRRIYGIAVPFAWTATTGIKWMLMSVVAGICTAGQLLLIEA
jgi:hypothetical protein